ncbi:hypothetical protein BSZ32_04090 [Rubritalea profundi]|uniref:Uncharacterized protein n=1 Tax=Rubritalea profundi TaxID=1658618 RepID=A0A2S7U0P9_9BACT|nr:hypothetical protein BSZ32_04090 [Rubritalea profundi]
MAYAAYMVKHETNNPPHDQNGHTITRISCTPISDAFCQQNTLADNEFHEGMRRFNLVALLFKCLAKGRRSDAVELPYILITLFVWPVLKSASIHCICSELCQYIKIGAQKKSSTPRQRTLQTSVVQALKA